MKTKIKFFSYIGFFSHKPDFKETTSFYRALSRWLGTELKQRAIFLPILGIFLEKKVNFKQQLAFMGFLLKPGGRSKSYCQAQANCVQAEQIRTDSVLVLFKAEPSNGQLFHF